MRVLIQGALSALFAATHQLTAIHFRSQMNLPREKTCPSGAVAGHIPAMWFVAQLPHVLAADWIIFTERHLDSPQSMRARRSFEEVAEARNMPIDQLMIGKEASDTEAWSDPDTALPVNAFDP